MQLHWFPCERQTLLSETQFQGSEVLHWTDVLNPGGCCILLFMFISCLKWPGQGFSDKLVLQLHEQVLNRRVHFLQGKTSISVFRLVFAHFYRCMIVLFLLNSATKYCTDLWLFIIVSFHRGTTSSVCVWERASTCCPLVCTQFTSEEMEIHPQTGFQIHLLYCFCHRICYFFNIFL